MLLVTAGLFLRSFAKTIGVDRGFDAENIAAVDLSLPAGKYRQREDANAFFRRLRDSVRELPGIVQAGYVSMLPLTAEGDISTFVKEGSQHLPFLEQPVVTYRTVSPEYFPTMGIPLRSGRLFVEDGEKERAAMISESVAARVWPGESAMGKRFVRGGNDVKDPANWWRVIGVVGDVRAKALDKEPEMIVYMPYFQRGAGNLSLVVRTAMDPNAAAAAIRERVWRVDSEVPVPPVRTMDRIVSDSVSHRRFQAILVAIFAALAMLLASIGIYGVIAYAVAGRRAELGVRVALGATAPQLHRLVIAQGMWPVAAGLAVGMLGAASVARLLRGFLFGVSALDPLSFSAVAALLLAISLAACFVPARRAGRIDPMHALRYE
jgi:putative ABC transport system permease protein